MEQTTIGKRIIALRKSRGLTQEQLAEKVGVSAQAVSKWENDVSCPDISLLPKLAEVFQVTTDSLLGVPEKTEIVEQPPQAKQEEKPQNGLVFQWDGGKAEFSIGSLPWFATALLLFAVSMLLNRTILSSLGHASVWSLLWPSVVLACGLASLWEKINIWAVGFTLFGAYYLLDNMGILPWHLQHKWNLVLLVILILWAVSMILTHLSQGKRSSGVSSCRTKDGVIAYDGSFCSQDMTVSEEVLRGGVVDLAFGSCTLDLRGCKQADPDCVLKTDLSFSSLKILLPKHWTVQDSTDRSLSSVTFHGAPAADADQVLRMKNDVSFGNLEIFWNE